ncbi:hypothetical protein SLEP1_g14259 [Rubroshorea leprosula]|uniref:Uncharacterized protein n=1 Tax=Rubroshorea leprosula TaxID=152421 RepID=A0AAV5IUZ3_9ROSI|nr:hypothetical protein SLEP1_g14259 [Rubroshorea leprosula]
MARAPRPKPAPCALSPRLAPCAPTPLLCILTRARLAAYTCPAPHPTPYHRTSHHHTLAHLQPTLHPADSASLLLHPSSLQQPTPPLCATPLLQPNLSAPPFFCNRILHPTWQPTEHDGRPTSFRVSFDFCINRWC